MSAIQKITTAQTRSTGIQSDTSSIEMDSNVANDYNSRYTKIPALIPLQTSAIQGAAAGFGLTDLAYQLKSSAGLMNTHYMNLNFGVNGTGTVVGGTNPAYLSGWKLAALNRFRFQYGQTLLDDYTSSGLFMIYQRMTPDERSAILNAVGIGSTTLATDLTGGTTCNIPLITAFDSFKSIVKDATLKSPILAQIDFQKYQQLAFNGNGTYTTAPAISSSTIKFFAPAGVEHTIQQLYLNGTGQKLWTTYYLSDDVVGQIPSGSTGFQYPITRSDTTSEILFYISQDHADGAVGAPFAGIPITTMNLSINGTDYTPQPLTAEENTLWLNRYFGHAFTTNVYGFPFSIIHKDDQVNYGLLKLRETNPNYLQLVFPATTTTCTLHVLYVCKCMVHIGSSGQFTVINN